MAKEKKIAIRDGPDRDEWLYNELRREGYNVSSHYFIKKDKVSELQGLADKHAANCELDSIARSHEASCFYDDDRERKPLTRSFPTMENRTYKDFNSSSKKWLDGAKVVVNGKERPMTDGEKRLLKFIIGGVIAIFCLSNPIFLIIGIILYSNSQKNSTTYSRRPKR